jgi:hypothetical protein
MKSIKHDKLHQLNVTYSSKEDRLLLRVTTQQGDEYRIWLTRRFTTLLLNVLNNEMDKFGGAAKIGSDPKTRDMFKAGAMEKSFEQEKVINYPFGKEGFLAYAIKTAGTSKGNIQLEILPEKGQGVSMNLDKPLLYMCHTLLDQGISQAEWYIPGSQDPVSRRVH